MKIRFSGFRVLLPLIMTATQLGLLATSLIIHREPWVLSPPPKLQVQSQSDCSGADCTVTFEAPPEPRAGRILKAAMLLNLPAVFLGDVVHIATSVLHVPHFQGEPSLLLCTALFVPLIWYRVGKWLDDQRTLNQFTQQGLKTSWTVVARVAVWCLFGLLLITFLIERHRQPEATRFLSAVAALWTGAYLALGLLGDRRRAALHRVAVE
jgi:hypothetical protein